MGCTGSKIEEVITNKRLKRELRKQKKFNSEDQTAEGNVTDIQSELACGSQADDNTTKHKENSKGESSSASGATYTIKSNKMKPSHDIELSTLFGSKPIAFNILLDENKDNSKVMKPPKRFQKYLDPLIDAPRLTAEQLEAKLQLAEDKRNQQLEIIKEKTRNLQRKQAREISNLQSQFQLEFEEKQRSADKNKKMKRIELEEKKKCREEKARLAREKAKEIKKARKENGNNVDYEKEVLMLDSSFNGEGKKITNDTVIVPSSSKTSQSPKEANTPGCVEQNSPADM